MALFSSIGSVASFLKLATRIVKTLWSKYESQQKQNSYDRASKSTADEWMRRFKD